MPISPAAQKFHLFILCSALDSSFIVSSSFVLGLALGKRHIADVNQNIAEPHAAIIAPVSMKDLMITPSGSAKDRNYSADPSYHMVMSAIGASEASRRDRAKPACEGQSGHAADTVRDRSDP